MATVELRPGDTLNIVWSSVQDTPLGSSEVESSFAFTYEELLVRLKSKGKMSKSRRSGTAGARFSRFVALSTNALKKGKWSTGADIDKEEVFDKLIAKLNSLDVEEHHNITLNAKKSLISIYQSKNILKQVQKNELKKAIDKIEINISTKDI